MVSYILVFLFSVFMLVGSVKAGDSQLEQSIDSIKQQQESYREEVNIPIPMEDEVNEAELREADTSKKSDVIEFEPNNVRYLKDDELNKCGFCCGRLACFYGYASDKEHDSCSHGCCCFSLCPGDEIGLVTMPCALAYSITIVPLMGLFYYGSKVALHFATEREDEKFVRSYKRGTTCYPEDFCSYTFCHCHDFCHECYKGTDFFRD